MFEELTTLTPFTMKFLWLLHKSERTQYGSEDPPVFLQHLSAVHVFSALALFLCRQRDLCFHLCILPLSSVARLHEHLNMCATKKSSESLRKRSNIPTIDEDAGNKFNNKKSTVATQLMSEQKDNDENCNEAETQACHERQTSGIPAVSKGSKGTARCKTRELPRRRSRQDRN